MKKIKQIHFDKLFFVSLKKTLISVSFLLNLFKNDFNFQLNFFITKLYIIQIIISTLVYCK